MHQSIVTTVPPGPGNSRNFDFRSSQSQVKSPPCGDKRLVNSPPKAPAPRYIPISPLYLARKQNHRIHPALRGNREGKNTAHFPRFNRYSPGPGGAVVSIDWCIITINTEVYKKEMKQHALSLLANAVIVYHENQSK